LVPTTLSHHHRRRHAAEQVPADPTFELVVHGTDIAAAAGLEPPGYTEQLLTQVAAWLLVPQCCVAAGSS
jgi:hypothetical protein